MNLVGGNYWLVLVNEAGNWLGKIVGGPEGSNIAGSETMQFIVNDAGEIAVVNSGNGTGSENTGSVAQTNNTNITQTNDAKIVNNVNLAANTGRNSASQNTGGDTKVQTGDATIVANIVNFVNNNIVGDGKLFVTVVNVFGSWIGDFVGPGQKKDETQAVASVGGQSQSNTVTTTPTPTTTIVKVAKAITPKAIANRVLGMSVTNDEGTDTNTLLMSTTDNSDEDVLALGDTTTAVKSARAERNKVRVNLAWGLLALPIGVLLLLSKKKLLPLLSRAHK
jgi:hypothetical protein